MWFDALLAALPGARVLEVGAGPGLLAAHARRRFPGRWVASDLLPVPGNDLAADALRLPVRDASLDGVAGLDVLHHLARPAAFFAEAGRALSRGGRLALVEPWVTPFSYPIYRFLHQEGCRLGIDPWEPFGPGPGKDAFEGDGALPWKLLRSTGADGWRALGFEPPAVRILNGFAYLASLGLKPKSLLPAPLAGPLLALDHGLRRLAPWLGIRALLVWRRATS